MQKNEGNIIYRKFKKCDEYYTNPCVSTTVNVYKVRKLSKKCTTSFSSIETKCWLMPVNNNEFVVRPLCNWALNSV